MPTVRVSYRGESERAAVKRTYLRELKAGRRSISTERRDKGLISASNKCDNYMCKPYLLCICCSSLVSTTTQSFSRKNRTLTQLLRSRTQLSGSSLYLCQNSCFLWCPNDWKIREMIVNALLHTLLMNNVPPCYTYNNPREKIAHHQRIHSEKFPQENQWIVFLKIFAVRFCLPFSGFTHG